MAGRLKGLRAVVTEADDFMGPAVVDLFREEGATVLADRRDFTDLSAANALIAGAGRVDILIVNLSIPNPRALAHETTDEQWSRVFDKIVHPTHRLVRAVLPQMIERRAGKIVIVGSASALRGTPTRTCYGAARGAQHAMSEMSASKLLPIMFRSTPQDKFLSRTPPISLLKSWAAQDWQNSSRLFPQAASQPERKPPSSYSSCRVRPAIFLSARSSPIRAAG